jgi:hypothetical protein
LTQPEVVLPLVFGLSFLLYLTTLVLPYNLFTYVEDSPISLPEMAQRERAPAVVFLSTFATLFLLYALAYRSCRRRRNHRLALLILVLGLAMALLLSQTYPGGAIDMLDYVSQGEALAFFGTNPMATPPVQNEGAVFTPYSAHRYTSSPYGPVFTWISAGVVRLLGQESLLVNVVGFKFLAIAAYLAQALLIYLILLKRRPDLAAAGLLLFAWNPLILYEFAVNAHNDALMMAFALLGILFWEYERPILMTVSLCLSFLTKIPTAPLLPLLLLADARRQERRGDAWMTLLAGGMTALLVVGAAYLSLPDARESLAHLSRQSDLFTHSLPTVAQLLLRRRGMEVAAAQSIVRRVTLAALAILYAFKLWRTWRHPAAVLSHIYDVILFLLLFATPWFQPWYVTWLVALAALYPHNTAPAQAGIFAASVMTSYIVYGFVWFWIPDIANWSEALGITLLAVLTTYPIPWIQAAWIWSRSLRKRSDSQEKTVEASVG